MFSNSCSCKQQKQNSAPYLEHTQDYLTEKLARLVYNQLSYWFCYYLQMPLWSAAKSTKSPQSNRIPSLPYPNRRKLQDWPSFLEVFLDPSEPQTPALTPLHQPVMENDIKDNYWLDREPQQQKHLIITNNCRTFQTLTEIFRINFLSFKAHKLNIFKFMLLNCIPWGHSSLLIKWGFVLVCACMCVCTRTSMWVPPPRSSSISSAAVGWFER